VKEGSERKKSSRRETSAVQLGAGTISVRCKRDELLPSPAESRLLDNNIIVMLNPYGYELQRWGLVDKKSHKREKTFQ